MVVKMNCQYKALLLPEIKIGVIRVGGISITRPGVLLFCKIYQWKLTSQIAG